MPGLGQGDRWTSCPRAELAPESAACGQTESVDLTPFLPVLMAVLVWEARFPAPAFTPGPPERIGGHTLLWEEGPPAPHLASRGASFPPSSCTSSSPGHHLRRAGQEPRNVPCAAHS